MEAFDENRRRTQVLAPPLEVRSVLTARLIVLTLAFLVSAYLALIHQSLGISLFSRIAFVIILCAAANWASHLWSRHRAVGGTFLYMQFVLDSLIVTGIVYVTGGPISPFLFLYLPLVMAVTGLRSRSAGLIMSVFSAAIYAAMVWALLAGWVTPPDTNPLVEMPQGGLALQLIGLLSAMILITVATGFLTRKVRFSRLEAEASRRELQDLTVHQRQLVDELPDAVITTDAGFAITSMNQAASLFLGFEEAQVLGEDIFGLLEDLDGTPKEIHKAHAREEEFELSLSKNQQHQHVVCRVKPIYDGGQEIKAGYLFIFHDVTELRSVEEQLQVHERMAQLLSLASKEKEETGPVRTRVAKFVGESPVMQQVFKLIGRVAASNATILVTGESGTGKELVARAIHLGSARASMPFVPVNCGAIPENLIESELFGYKRGAFTGANSDYSGLFKQADGGTLFLDEIGELPLHMQTKLLRAIQDKAIRQLGGDRSISVDVRIIAASNRNIKKEVEHGNFREDLFYRLNVINIVIPPLRERKEDIPLLVNSLLRGLVGDEVSPVVPPAAMHLLMNYSYPGNVRELENVLERAYVLGGKVILPEHLPEAVQNAKPLYSSFSSNTTQVMVFEDLELPVHLDEILENIECKYLTAALKKTNGAKKKAADLLGINFRSFRYRMSKFGLGSEDGDNL